MTENEALEYIKNMAFMCGEYEKCQYGHQCTTKCLKATEIAIKALSEIQQYREIGTIEEFKALKEKNVAKKPIIHGLGQRYCPVCKCGGADHFYCARCGQKLG